MVLPRLSVLMPACLIASALSACHGPSCERACEKVFLDCRLTFLNPDEEQDASVADCAHACDADMNSEKDQAFAVGWVACVDDFQCDPDDEGIPLCVTCQSGYYVGQAGRAVVACQVEDDSL